ncbi:MAG: M48 family metalloprotease [Dysgonamonadaceae bacterium]|jgi:putative metalloprotease|nr:M48 family metalloprotease [Dysgonamonadaceae bacterium]
MKRITFLIAFALFFSVLANAQLGRRINVDRALNAVSQGVQSLTITDAQVIEYTNEYMVWMDANNPLVKTTDSDAGKQAVAERLANIVSVIPQELIDRYNLDIQAYYVVDVNAFAAANGAIRMFAGLMELMTDDEILAVVGHEIGHIANNDSKDAFVRALRVSALREAAGSVSGTVSRLSDSQLGELSAALANSQYSQAQEFEADAYGFELLKQLGKDPGAMASALGVLLKLQEEAGASGNSRFASLFSSHPDLARRIETLNAR